MAEPVKTYDLISDTPLTKRKLELQQNGQTILWISKKMPFMGQPTIQIQSESEHGPIVAACKLMRMSGGVRVLFSKEKGQVNPDISKEHWYNVLPNGFTNKEYEFRLGAGRFVWRRTHDSALGASSMGGMDFKLLDLSQGDEKATQKLLAVYIKSSKILKHRDIGRIDYVTDLGRELELMSLAALLGIEEKLRRRRKANGAGPAAGVGVGIGA